MSLRKMVEDYTLHQDPLPDSDIVDVDINAYHPYSPGVPIGWGSRPVRFFSSVEEKREHEQMQLRRIPKTSCIHCGYILGFTKHVNNVFFRFMVNLKAGRCPECKGIVVDYRIEHIAE